MEQVLIEEKTFKKQDLTANPLPKGDYEYCTFINCNFADADIANINRTSFNYVIDPENNKIKKAKFSLTGIAGLLEKYNIEISSR